MGLVYPQLIVRPNNMKHNALQILDIVKPHGISIFGLGKGFCCIPECMDALAEAGCAKIGGSRLYQLKVLKERKPETKTFLCRIPSISEAEKVVKWADTSLNSQLEVLEALNEAALSHGKVHEVILMKDIGDRREGWEDEEEFVETALKVEKEMKGLFLLGTGANFNCYGSIVCTPENTGELVAVTEKIEGKIGRRLDVISVGGIGCINLVENGTMPARINNIRAGICFITKAEYTWKNDIPDRKDTFRLRAEIIEIHNKPTLPRGSHGAASCNEVRHYEDWGTRKRAIVAIGSQDIGMGGGTITPVDPKLHVWGSSCDHTMVDIEEAEKDYRPGDYIEFNINYVASQYLTMSRDVNKIIEY